LDQDIAATDQVGLRGKNGEHCSLVMRMGCLRNVHHREHASGQDTHDQTSRQNRA
jgi:hypothetical protein